MKENTSQTLSVTEPTAEPQPSVEAVPLIEPEAKPEISETLTSGETLEARENVPETPVKTAPVQRNTNSTANCNGKNA